MRIVRVVAGAAVIVALVLTVFARETMPWWLGMVPAGVYVVLVALQAAVSARRRGPGPGLRDTVAPGVQGLDEVQGLYLGRPQGLVVSYGSDEPTSTAMVVDRPDPLDQPTWTIDPDDPIRRRSST